MTDARPAGRILVVDDDRGFRHAMTALLQEAGHLVVAGRRRTRGARRARPASRST